MASFDSPSTTTLQEFSGWGRGIYIEPALKVTFPDGNRDLVLHYVSATTSNDGFVVLKDTAGLERDAARRGRTPAISQQTVLAVIEKTTQQKPSQRTHWSTRSMARAVGISEASVRRIWRAHGLKPHRIHTFKLSNDPRFAEKLEDVVGLYLNPPEHALVLSLDEKSQIQALGPHPAGPAHEKGRAQTMTNDYKRYGTTTLFAALNTLDGTVMAACMERHRHQEWLKFLRLIDRQTAQEKQLHLIVDNYATHKHPDVLAWAARHPRFHFHFTPTSSSWLNMVERFFRDLTENQLRRGVFTSVEQLQNAIFDYIQQHNSQPKPFIWAAKATDTAIRTGRHTFRVLWVGIHSRFEPSRHSSATFAWC